MTTGLPKLGIVAGGGNLPTRIAEICLKQDRPFFLVAVDEFADHVDFGTRSARRPISKIGSTVKLLQTQKCEQVVFAGKFARPKDKKIALRPDLGGLWFLVRNFGVLRRSNDGIHRAFEATMTRAGFKVVSPLDAAPALAAARGPMNAHVPAQSLLEQFPSALQAAKAHGATRAGQAIVFCDGHIIAREGKAGTDAMMAAIKHPPGAPAAYLVKAMSPTQLPTMDPPAIGEHTVHAAAAAGLAGILVEAGKTILVEPERVRLSADHAGIFVYADSAGTNQ